MSRTFLLFLFLLSLTAIAVGVAWNNGQFPKELTAEINKYAGSLNSAQGGDSGNTSPSSTDGTSSTANGTPATPPANALQKFSNEGPFSSRPFDVADQWEVDWDSPGSITVTLCSLDGSPDQVIGQQAGPSHGSSFQAKGGKFYLKITSTGPWSAWTIPVVGNGSNNSSVASSRPPVSPSSNTQNPIGMPPGNPSGGSNNATDSDYIQKSIVIVRGTAGVGTGFLIKMGDSTCVITNQHVISDNPGLSFQTLTGRNLQVMGAEAAADRDLALIFVRNDDGTLPIMPLASNVGETAKAKDPVIVPGNSQGGGVIVNTPGNIVGIGPIKLEVSNPVYPGNSGSPVVDLNLKQAVGVIAEAEKSDDEGWLNQYSMANQESAIKQVRYYSLRLDNVGRWEPIQLEEFYRQTHSIEDFHEHSMEIASFIRALLSQRGNAEFGDSDISPNLYRRDSKLSDLMDQFNASMNNASQADIAARAQQYLFVLQGVAEEDVTTMNILARFYTFNRERVKDELALRKVLSDACDKVFNRVSAAIIGQ